MTRYTCSKCGAPVTVRDGQIDRACTCVAPVTAHLKAHASGAGGVK